MISALTSQSATEMAPSHAAGAMPAAGPEESCTSEVQRLQKLCRRNCCVFAAPRQAERQLTAENTECCRTRGINHLPSREATTRTANGKLDMPL